MDSSGLVLLAGGALVLSFFALLMWWVIRHEQLKADMTHAERQTALERGIPLPDAEVARCRSLGWIGVVVPVASLSMAAGVTALLVPPRLPEPSVGGLVAVWAVCGAVAANGVVAAVLRLRSRTGAASTVGSPDAAPGTSDASDGGGNVSSRD
jgi:hypothetical protein